MENQGKLTIRDLEQLDAARTAITEVLTGIVKSQDLASIAELSGLLSALAHRGAALADLCRGIVSRR